MASVKTREPKLTAKQRIFADAYVADPSNLTKAAEEAGFAVPHVAGAKLMNRDENPLVVAYVEAELAKRSERAKKSGDDVLQYIHTCMFFNPLRYFLPGSEGGWEISKDMLKELPDHIACFIDSLETTTSEKTDSQGNVVSTETTYKIKFVSKVAAMTLAAKHQLGDKVNQNVKVTLNWDDLFKSVTPPGLRSIDPSEELFAQDDIEQVIANVEQQALAAGVPMRNKPLILKGKSEPVPAKPAEPEPEIKLTKSKTTKGKSK